MGIKISNTIPSYSPEAAASRSLFYQNLNDINIYVEDSGKEYEYETIFKRLMGDKYNISTIFGLGGKERVKEHFKENVLNTNQHYKVQNFYIVDGDFDRYIHSEGMITHPNFLYLKTYNIENYFLDENASISFSKGRLKCVEKLVTEKIRFMYWKDTIVAQSSDLFFSYCFLKKYHPEEKTVSRSPFSFLWFFLFYLSHNSKCRITTYDSIIYSLLKCPT